MKPLILLLVGSALLLTEAVPAENEPRIAMRCGKTTMFYNLNENRWVPDGNGTDCLRNPKDILSYCQQTYPNNNIDNYYQASSKVDVGSWCKSGKSLNCHGHSHSVSPIYCISSKSFKAKALSRPAKCQFKRHKASQSGCASMETLKKLATDTCHNKGGMVFINEFSVNKPCPEAGMYGGLHFVCCPKDYMDSTPVLKKSPLPVELGPVLMDTANNKQDVCNLPFVKGDCRASLPVYYYDASLGQCVPRLYGGCGGNKNNFENEGDCLKACKPSEAVTAAAADSSAELATKVVLSRAAECLLPADPGYCRALFYKWHYDAEAGRCKQFTWGGCQGNDNRFSSEAECQARCDPCAEPPKREMLGTCKAAFQRYRFNHDLGRCEQFVYGGCGRKSNLFDTMQDCESLCPARKTTTTKATTTTTTTTTPAPTTTSTTTTTPPATTTTPPPTTTTPPPTTTTTSTTTSTRALDVLPTEVTTMPSAYDPATAKFDRERSQYMQLRAEENQRYEEQLEKAELEEAERLWADHDSAMQKIEDYHQTQVDEIIVEVRTSAFAEYTSQADADQIDIEKMEMTMRKYVESERIDKQHVVEHFQIILEDFGRDEAHQPLKRSQLQQTTAQLYQRINTIQDRLRSNLLRMSAEVREILAQEIEDATRDLLGGNPIVLDSAAAVDSRLDLAVSDDEDVYVEGSTDDDDDDDDYKTMLDEDEYTIDEEYYLLGSNVNGIPRLGKTGEQKPAMGAKDEPPMFRVAAVDDEESEEGGAMLWYVLWVVLALVALLLVLLFVRLTTARQRQAVSDMKSRQHQINRNLTPEERQLLQMQQNGFENPTYKFFEKQHQVA